MKTLALQMANQLPKLFQGIYTQWSRYWRNCAKVERILRKMEELEIQLYLDIHM